MITKHSGCSECPFGSEYLGDCNGMNNSGCVHWEGYKCNGEYAERDQWGCNAKYCKRSNGKLYYCNAWILH